MNKLNISIFTILALAMLSCSNSVGVNNQDSENELQAMTASKDKSASNKANMVELCHITNGNVDRSQTMTVSSSAAEQHLANHAGDRLGNCEDAPPPPRINTAPIIELQNHLNFSSETPTSEFTVTVTDIDGDPLTVSAEVSTYNGLITPTIDLTSVSNGVYSFTISIAATESGSGTITISAFDGTVTSTADESFNIEE